MTIWDDLAAPFPEEAISWRAQSVTKNGDKAMALAYIDARDVMNRLDDVLGPDNWKDRYEFNAATAICYLALRINNEWIEKADGAGSTDVEAEKGQISDALKRAAVKWKIGRYLYDMPAPWVPCESYEKNGKRYWSKWTADPWDFVRRQPSTPPKPSARPVETAKNFNSYLTSLTSSKTLGDAQAAFAIIWKSDLSSEDKVTLQAAYEAQKVRIATPDFSGMEA